MQERFNELGNIQWNFKFRQDGNQVARKVVDVNDGLVILGNNVAPEGIFYFFTKDQAWMGKLYGSILLILKKLKEKVLLSQKMGGYY